MIRRLQLLPTEGRSSGSLAAMGDRIRDGLLRDNKVVPAVLGLLALLIFTWLIAGAIMGGPSEEEEAAQSSLTQGGQDSDSGPQETPAPGVENRDTDSYSAFESKDPFRSLVPKADEGKAGESKTGDSKSGDSKSGDSKSGDSKSGDSKSGDSKSGEPKSGESKGGETKSGEPKGGEPKGSTSPGGDRPGAIPPGEDRPDGASGGSGDGAPDGGDQPVPGDPSFGGGDPQGAPDQDGNGNLFNSGGDLPTP